MTIKYAPIEVTRDQAILGFLRIDAPDAVAKAEKLVDELIKMVVKGIASPTPEPAPELQKEKR